jgi:hypothetical protein
MEHLGWILLAAIASGFGGYFGSYLKKKGENLATHEDLDKLVKQVEATTEATKRIEATISNEVWDRQRQWEMKRDAVVGVIQSLCATEDALMTACVFYELLTENSTQPHKEAYEKALLDWKEKMTVFESKRTIARLMCSDEFNVALTTVRNAIRKGLKWITNKTITTYNEIGPLVSPAMQGAVMAARKELGLPQDIIPHSNVSLAVPSPAQK